MIRKCFSGREINLRGSPSFSCVKQFELRDCMGAVSGCDNLRDNRAVRWGAVLADNQVAAACSRSVVLNNISCSIVRVRRSGRDNLRDNRAARWDCGTCG